MAEEYKLIWEVEMTLHEATQRTENKSDWGHYVHNKGRAANKCNDGRRGISQVSK